MEKIHAALLSSEVASCKTCRYYSRNTAGIPKLTHMTDPLRKLHPCQWDASGVENKQIPYIWVLKRESFCSHYMAEETESELLTNSSFLLCQVTGPRRNQVKSLKVQQVDEGIGLWPREKDALNSEDLGGDFVFAFKSYFYPFFVHLGYWYLMILNFTALHFNPFFSWLLLSLQWSANHTPGRGVHINTAAVDIMRNLMMWCSLCRNLMSCRETRHQPVISTSQEKTDSLHSNYAEGNKYFRVG